MTFKLKRWGGKTLDVSVGVEADLLGRGWCRPEQRERPPDHRATWQLAVKRKMSTLKSRFI